METRLINFCRAQVLGADRSAVCNLELYAILRPPRIGRDKSMKRYVASTSTLNITSVNFGLFWGSFGYENQIFVPYLSVARGTVEELDNGCYASGEWDPSAW